jgi:hypothetical protein
LNWPDDDLAISTGFFANTLPEALKKYYTPNYGMGGRVISYRRRKENWVTNTNKIIEIQISLNTNTAFANGELINIKDGGEFVGRAEILFANDSVLISKNISGNTTSNTALVLGLTTEANANLIETETLDTTIPDEEFVYWTPCTFFDWERQKNENNKNIYLLDANYSLQVAEELRRSMENG